VFTGIVEEVGRVTGLVPEGGGLHLEIAGPGICEDLKVGDSVSVAGTCQTVTEIEGGRFRVFAMGETLRATTLGRLKTGDAVNLERALTPGGRLGGHFVTGHVDGVARLRARRDEGAWLTLDLEMDEELAGQLVPKGSLALDGVSLTVGAEVRREGCSVHVIPHTLAETTLDGLRPGDELNIETDLLGKYVLRYLERGREEDRDASLMNLMVREGLMKEQS